MRLYNCVVRLSLFVAVCATAPDVFSNEDPATGRRRLVVQSGHSNTISEIAVSSDSRRAVTASWDGTAKLWDLDTGREIQTYAGHTATVTCVDISPDGKRVVTGSRDGSVRLWDLVSGEQQHVSRAHWSGIVSVAFSPDGRSIVTGSYDSVSKILNAKFGVEMAAFGGDNAGGRTAMSADGQLLVTGSKGQTGCVWDVESRMPLADLEGHTEDILCVAFSPDGTLVATGSEDSTVKLWDPSTGHCRTTLKTASGAAWSVAFSADGEKLVIGDSQYMTVCDTTTWQQILSEKIFPADFIGTARTVFTPDGHRLLSSVGSIARLSDANSGEEVRLFGGRARSTSHVTVFNDGRRLAASGFTAAIWDIEASRPVGTIGEPLLPVQSLAVSADGETILSGGSWDLSRSAGVWDAKTTTLRHQLKYHGYPVEAIAISKDGDTAVTAGGAEVRAWNTQTGQLRRTFKGHEFNVRSLALSPDETMLATADGGPIVVGQQGGSVRIWNIANGEQRHEFPFTIGAEHVVWSPAGSQIAVANTGHPAWNIESSIQIWNPVTGQPQRVLPSESQVVALAYSPSGTVLFAAYEDRIVRGHDTQTGNEQFRIDLNGPAATSLSVFPDGRTLAVGGHDGTELWDIASKRRLVRLLTFEDGTWVVVDDEGRFEASDLEWNPGLHWIIDDEPLRPAPIEIFMRDYYEPKLLKRTMARERFRPVPDLSTINRVQPTVIVNDVQPARSGKTGRVDVFVSVTVGSRTVAGQTVDSGMQDLHLFRDGRLVGTNRLAKSTDVAHVCFPDVQIPNSADEVTFTAYAFNRDRVKSATSDPYIYQAESQDTQSRAYVISFGVDRFADHEPHLFGDLNFAVADALAYSEDLARSLERTKHYSEVVSVALTSSDDASTATKEHLKTVCGVLSGSVRPDILTIAANRLSEVTPDDAVFFAFSTHGFTNSKEKNQHAFGGREGEFYLVPADIGGSDGLPLLDRCISSEEIAEWFEGIDADELTVIIDACHAGASTGQDFKPGPMGNRGFGQLAYNKKMRILAASQSSQFALEMGGEIGHGLLSYALLRTGLSNPAADTTPNNGMISVHEWLLFAAEEVPRLVNTVKNSPAAPVAQSAVGDKGATLIGESTPQRVQTPVFFDFGKSARPSVISLIVEQ